MNHSLQSSFRSFAALAIAAGTGLLAVVPASAQVQQSAHHASNANQLTAAERAAGWKLLFDGSSFAGWHALGYKEISPRLWVVRDGAIEKINSGRMRTQADGQPLEGADLITDSTYGNFELTFQWKVTPGANSGVKYNVSEEMSLEHKPSHAALGFEYQVLDDSLHPDGKLPTHRASALYDLIAPNANKHLEPVGEWNTSRIVFVGKHGEHWLNGKKVVSYEMATPHFDSLMAKSKYHSIPGFADRRNGHIVLQFHPGKYVDKDGVWFRDIKIRELPASSR